MQKNKKKPWITFPHMGYYYPVFRTLVERLGGQAIVPPLTNKETIELGVRFSPEGVCFPFKVNVGNYLTAIEKGADTILMFDSQGDCRFRYYGLLQEKILRETGHQVAFRIFSIRNFLSELGKISGANYLTMARAAKAAWDKARAIEQAEDLAWWYRPRERQAGKATAKFKAAVRRIDRAQNRRELKAAIERTKKSFQQIKIDPKRQPLKIGVVGEIYLILESRANQDAEETLGQLGGQIHRHLRLSTFITHGLNIIRKKTIPRKTKTYLAHKVGGHGLESVYDMLLYAQGNFDGVVHIAPFGCMPETTVRPILARIQREKKLPLLTLTFDEHSGQAGVQTRLEAFMDMLRSRKH